jgi:hypothetical protein
MTVVQRSQFSVRRINSSEFGVPSSEFGVWSLEFGVCNLQLQGASVAYANKQALRARKANRYNECQSSCLLQRIDLKEVRENRDRHSLKNSLIAVRASGAVQEALR